MRLRTALLSVSLLVACGKTQGNKNHVPPTAPVVPPQESGDISADFSKAPPSFEYKSGLAVPANFEKTELKLNFDPQDCVMNGISKIEFSTEKEGFPFFDLVPNATSLKLDGVELSTALLPTISDPDKVTKVRVLEKKVEPRRLHVLEIGYSFKGEELRCLNEGQAVRMFFDMTDIHDEGRGFLEQYAPANYEYDQFAQKVTIDVSNTSREHEVYTNAVLTKNGKNHFEMSTPSFYNSSSLYLHVTPKDDYLKKTDIYKGMEKEIPITFYGRSQSSLDDAMIIAKKTFATLENAYGPFVHDKYVGLITGQGGGGMEYCGATVTSVLALSHEIAHSWYARGVMPASGNAGWIDEAVATWSAGNFRRASSEPNRNAVNLANNSKFDRRFEYAAYTLGAKLIEELDYMFAAKGGMRALLGQFYKTNKQKVVETEEFKQTLATLSGRNLDAIFDRYVYGKRAAGEQEAPEPAEESMGENPFHKLTPEQLEVLRN